MRQIAFERSAFEYKVTDEAIVIVACRYHY